MSMPSYIQRVDSGDPLIGSVPAHWKSSALKRLGSYQNGFAFKPEDWANEGRPIIRIAQLTNDAEPNYFAGELDERLRVSNGDLLFSWSATIDSFIWVKGEAWLNQHIFKVTPTEEATKAYLFYLIKFLAPKLADLDAHGSTIRHIKKESLGQLVYVPPIEEQIAISTFLDCETAKIDALIAEQEKLIALLAEKRKATISHAVTKGLDSDALMKDSDVAWMGEVPAHWHIAKLGLYATIENGTTPSRAAPEYWDGGNIPWLASGEVNQLKITEAAEFITAAALKNCSLRLLPAGTVVVGMIGQGKTRGMSAILTIPATINQNLAAICPDSRIEGMYILYLLHAVYEWLREAGRGGNQAAMNCEILAALRIPLPPLTEQRVIVDFIEVEAAKLNSLRAHAEHAVALLKERRSALIAGAVTGQVDVRGAISLTAMESPEAIAA